MQSDILKDKKFACPICGKYNYVKRKKYNRNKYPRRVKRITKFNQKNHLLGIANLHFSQYYIKYHFGCKNNACDAIITLEFHTNSSYNFKDVLFQTLALDYSINNYHLALDYTFDGEIIFSIFSPDFHYVNEFVDLGWYPKNFKELQAFLLFK